MVEGIEIVVDPRKLLMHGIYIVIIIVLAILLIIHWNGGSSAVKSTTKTTIPAAVLNSTNQTTNTTNASQTANLCTSGVKDADETDVDCGGTKCPGCGEFKNCNVDKDCVSGLYCSQHIKCVKPTCTDGAKNQDETNIDCGGVCGGYWWASDSKCHSTTEPSGKLSITLSADVGASDLSGNAILNSLTIKLDNGLSQTLILTAKVYALDDAGIAVFPDQAGDNKPIETVNLDSITSGAKLNKTISFVNNTLRTLAGVKATDAYQLLVEFRDSANQLVDRKTWTNS